MKKKRFKLKLSHNFLRLNQTRYLINEINIQLGEHTPLNDYYVGMREILISGSEILRYN